MPDYLSNDYFDQSSSGSTYTGDYGYTSTSLVERYMGEAGVSLITDDLSPGDMSNAIKAAILEAEDFLLQYLLHRYEPTSLTNSSWVTRRATELACYFLFQRRGQHPPDALTATFVRIEEDLEKIANSDRLIVPGAAARKQGSPVLSNYAIDGRRIHNRMRVIPNQTTGQHPHQKPLRLYPQDPMR